MSAERQKILIVDDTLTNIEILNGILQGDHDIYFAKSGEAALRIVQREEPDLILLDIMMPEMDGYEVCARLKKDPKTVHIPVIFITAMGQEEAETKGLECGAIDYITKPIHAPIVKARVKNHLELKMHRDVLEHLTVQLASKNEELQKLAIQDGLTGLANRRRFDEVLAAEIRRGCRSGRTLSLVLCDVDFFKRFNDHYGHVAGDRCLQQVSSVLRETFRRAGDLPARYGGEEFAVILPETGLQEARVLAERLRQEIISKAIPHQGSTVAPCLTISIGVAGGTLGRGTDPQSYVKAADRALYLSKENGRNRVTSVSVCDADSTEDVV